MAKKKRQPEPEGKVRFELRFDADVYEKVKGIADDAEISVNQLMQGIARWAGERAVIGEPLPVMGGHSTKPVAGCVWFASASSWGMGDDDGEGVPVCDGWPLFCLDFTDRRVIRDEWVEREKGAK